jgi:cytochrome b561
LMILVLMSLRLVWRSRSTSPVAISTISKSNLLAATAVKAVLYIGVFIIGITGYLITTGEGQGADFFGLISVPATIELSADNIDRAGAIHKYMAWSLMGIALLHAAAALFHHFVKRDKTLVRMLKPADDAD